MRFVDINGDGLVDSISAREGGLMETRLNGMAQGGVGWSQPNSAYVLPAPVVSGSGVDLGVRFTDLNGDGLLDLVYVNAGFMIENRVCDAPEPNPCRHKTNPHNLPAFTYYAWLNTGSGWQPNNLYAPPIEIMSGGKDRGTRFVDLNGDGLTDLISGRDGSRQAWLNTGHRNGQSVWVASSTYAPPLDIVKTHDGDSQGVRIVDLNGDGLDDILASVEGTGGIQKAWLNTGSGWGQPSHATAYIPPAVIAGASNGEDRGVRLTDVNGDGISDFIVGRHNNTHGVWLNRAKQPRITSITDGFGLQTAIDYQSLADKTNPVYSKDAESSYPENTLHIARHVVASHEVSNGIGGTLGFDYHYEQLKTHLKGYGPLGFARMKVTDRQTNVSTTMHFKNTAADYPHIGAPWKVEQHRAGQLLSSNTTTYATRTETWGTTTTILPYASQVREDLYHLNNAGTVSTHISTRITDTQMGAFGNPDKVIVSVENPAATETYSTETSSVYDNITTGGKWHLGRLRRATVTKAVNGVVDPASTRVSAFEYDAVSGLMTKEIVEPDKAEPFKLVTVYGYDTFGNKIVVTTCATDYASCAPDAPGPATLPFRTTKTGFTSNAPSQYPDGMFATSITNALGHTETRTYDARFGEVTSQTGPNGLTTTRVYDNYGRQIREDRVDGTRTTTGYSRCYGGCAPGAAYFVISRVSNPSQSLILPAAITYHDSLQREIRTQTTGFDGTTVYSDIHYDAQARVLKRSEPYFAGATTIHWSTPTYDVLNRETKLDYPKGDGTTLSITTAHNPLSVVVTDANGHQRTTNKNIIGQTVSVTDHNNQTLQYRYDALGNLKETQDPNGNIVHIDYDVLGRKTAMTDPDMGGWSYSYNAFGELVSQTDAKNQTTTMTYDTLGRMVQRIDLAGSGATTEQVSSWVFDSAVGAGIGKLKSTTGPTNNPSTTIRELEYDTLGRVVKTRDFVDGSWYDTRQQYDALSRPEMLTYPVTTAHATGFQVKRLYNTHGYLHKVQSADGSKTFWEATASNARGAITDDQVNDGIITTQRAINDANGWIDGIFTSHSVTSAAVLHVGYTFDSVGNLLSRTDHRQTNVSEAFVYDALDRLTSATVTGQAAISYAYDALGNITNKGDIGAYTYGTCSAGPHAVCQAGGNSYSYDANGNMISTSNGGVVRQVQYNAHNKPGLITKGSETVAFMYGTDRSRVLKIVNNDRRTAYIGLGAQGGVLFERETDTAAGTTKDLHFIYAGGQAIAAHIAEGATTHNEYYHRDHLGSVEAMTDDSNAVIATKRKSFDAWGKGRNPAGWVGAPPATSEAVPGHFGFTGHETLANVGLIHMNGRVYDAEIGRFLSADPNVQFRADLQNYNRYSYVNNNPLRYTDPSGYFLKKLVKAAFFLNSPVFLLTKGGQREFRNNEILQAGLQTGSSVASAITGQAWIASLASAYATKVMGGSWGDALKSGLLTYGSIKAFNALHGWDPASVAGFVAKGLTHGLVGGAFSELGGGEFRDGFLGSALSFTASATGAFEALGATNAPLTGGDYAYNAVVAGLIGGTVSRLSGGKFSNGARSAAFSRLFNDLAISRRVDLPNIEIEATPWGTIDYNGRVVRNSNVTRNLNALRQGLTIEGYSQGDYDIIVTGGESYIDGDVVRSNTNNSVVPDRLSNSAHNIENGARAVDIRNTDIPTREFNRIVENYTNFIPRNGYPDGHHHLRIPNRSQNCPSTICTRNF